MKLEMLKKLILETLEEVYEMTPADEAELKRRGLESEDDWWLRRQVGLQPDDEVERDIQNLRDYQAKVQGSPEGQAMIRAFRSGNGVTIAHGLGYVSYAESELGGSGDETRKSLSNWISKYGKLNKNQLSTVAWIGSPADIPSGYASFSNHEAITGGTGFLLKGYPVLVSGRSVSSQTLSSLPSTLVQHQEQSGIAKRGDVETPIYSLQEMAEGQPFANWAGEVLLDNWEVIGCYITTDILMGARRDGKLSQLFEDVGRTRLQCHIFSESAHMGTVDEFKKRVGLRSKRRR